MVIYCIISLIGQFSSFLQIALHNRNMIGAPSSYSLGPSTRRNEGCSARCLRGVAREGASDATELHKLWEVLELLEQYTMIYYGNLWYTMVYNHWNHLEYGI